MDCPVIGITGMRHNLTSRAAAQGIMAVLSADDYSHGVEAAGGAPFVLPYITEESTLEAWSDRLDGLILAGGEDVDPLLFGEEPKNGLGSIVPERDILEIKLIHLMMKRNKPILGICRGMQVINVAFGGSLYQDLGNQWSGKILHRQRAARNYLSHHVKLEPDSLVSRCLGGKSEILCNSFHHQAVKDLAEGFRPTGWDPEGLIEAMEHNRYPFLVAVQWHPENLWKDYSEFLGLFKGLVDACQCSCPPS